MVRLGPPPGSVGFGGAVAGLGDVDGDGIGDVVVGAPGSDRAYVVSGGTGAILRHAVAPAVPELRFGAALARVGDVDRDGVPDFAVGAPSELPVVDPSCPSHLQCGGLARGRAFLFSGSSAAMIRELVPLTTGDSDFGRSVTGAGDVSGDGVPDVVVGAPGHRNEPGSVFAFSGVDGAPLWSRTGPSASFGELIRAVADLSGDGIADLLVGILDQGPSPVVSDRVRLLSGATGVVVRGISDPAPTRNDASDAFGPTVAPLAPLVAGGDHSLGRDPLLIRSMAVPADGRIGIDAGTDPVVGDPSEPAGEADYLLYTGPEQAPVVLATQSVALAEPPPLQAQATSPTTTVPPGTPITTTTAPVATTRGGPATASLPKPATLPTAQGVHPHTGAAERRTVGLVALGLGMTGITVLRRVRKPAVRRTPSTG